MKTKMCECIIFVRDRDTGKTVELGCCDTATHRTKDGTVMCHKHALRFESLRPGRIKPIKRKASK